MQMFFLKIESTDIDKQGTIEYSIFSLENPIIIQNENSEIKLSE